MERSAMTVGTWQPGAPAPELTAEMIERLLAFADRSDDTTLGMSQDDVQRLAPLMRLEPAEWQRAGAGRSDRELIQLVRFFTLAEARLSGWHGGERSPVIPLVSELRRREAYPAELTRWIRSVSDNRFLPYGSVMDRL
jgi:hypothetical protein